MRVRVTLRVRVEGEGHPHPRRHQLPSTLVLPLTLVLTTPPVNTSFQNPLGQNVRPLVLKKKNSYSLELNEYYLYVKP